MNIIKFSKRLTLILTLCFLAISSNQAQNTDSLATIYNSLESSIEKANLAIDLTRSFASLSLVDSSEYFGQAEIKLFEDTNDQEGVGAANMALATIIFPLHTFIEKRMSKES